MCRGLMPQHFLHPPDINTKQKIAQSKGAKL
jgi:hypothetical protein